MGSTTMEAAATTCSARCDPYVNKLLTGEDFDYHCHSNLTRAILPHGLTELDVHDVLNVFQVTGLTSDGDRYFMKASPAREGDFLELFAEIDLLCALSTCPGGDLSVPLWGADAGEPATRLPAARRRGPPAGRGAPGGLGAAAVGRLSRAARHHDAGVRGLTGGRAASGSRVKRAGSVTVPAASWSARSLVSGAHA
jgi:hypothetical protein